ncbi:MAG: hypothetical protein LAP87_06005 [Acidobacteriia bacterium]|nr:hypothetical protein [Terriglobia bacterium]
MDLLAETILDSIKDLNRDHQIALEEAQERRARAIELTIYKLKTLNSHIHKSRLLLNDLRTLRRLILNERTTVEQAMTAM